MEETAHPSSEESSLLRLIQGAKSLTDDKDYARMVNGRLYGELGGVVKHLNDMLKAIESVKAPIHSTVQDLPEAVHQLDDVTRLTEEGTHRVLEHAEQVLSHRDQIANRVDALEKAVSENFPSRENLKEQTRAIHGMLEEDKKVLMDLVGALEFQDLAGQRLKKMEAALQEIQARILQLVVVFGLTLQGEAITSDKREVLNELQEASAKHERLNQGLVDNILKEFGF